MPGIFSSQQDSERDSFPWRGVGNDGKLTIRGPAAMQIAMKAHCPTCSTPLNEVGDVPGFAKVYDCTLCSSRFRIGTLQVALSILVPIALLLAILYWLPEDLLPREVGGLLGAAVVGIGPALLPRLARFERLSAVTAVVPAAGEIGFLRALGIDNGVRLLIHTHLLVGIGLGGMMAVRWPEVDYIFPLMGVVLLGLSASILFSFRCPSCQLRLAAQAPMKWKTIRSMTACPKCGFVPPVDANVVAATERSRGGVLVLALLYTGAIASSVYLVQRGVLRAPQLPSPSAPALHEARFDWSFEDLQGNSHQADELRGKVIFLNRWSSWCLPCRPEMPSIAQLWQVLGDEVVFAIVSDDSLTALRDVATEQNPKLPLYRIEDDLAGGMLKGERLPRTCIIDAQGQVRFKVSGPRDWSRPEVVDYLRALAHGNDKRLAQTAEQPIHGIQPIDR